MDYKYSNHELTVQINISNREGKSCKAYTFSIIPPLAPPLPLLLIKQPHTHKKAKAKARRGKKRKRGGGTWFECGVGWGGMQKQKTELKVSSFTVRLDKQH